MCSIHHHQTSYSDLSESEKRSLISNLTDLMHENSIVFTTVKALIKNNPLRDKAKPKRLVTADGLILLNN